MTLPPTDPPPGKASFSTAMVGKHEVRYLATPDNRANRRHTNSPYLASWYPPRSGPSDAPQSIVVKEFRLQPTGHHGKAEIESEREANRVKREREKGAYETITPIQGRGSGRWLLRCYGWDLQDRENWKAVFEQAGPDSMSFSQELAGRNLQDFVEVVLLCSYDAITELSRNGVHTRDVHPGNILLPLNHTSKDIPDHVILGDFDHAYLANGPITAGTSSGMGATTSLQVLVGHRHEGRIDDLFSVAATCYILLTGGQTVWLKGHLRANYIDNHSKEWLVNKGYQIQPDTTVLDTLNSDLSHVLRGLLLDDRAERQRAIDSPSFDSALERIRARHVKRLQGRANPKVVSETVFARPGYSADNSAWHIPDNPRRRARSRSDVWGYDRWAALKNVARGVPAWSFLPSLMIPAVVFLALGHGLVWGQSNPPNWFDNWWSIPQALVAAAVLPVSWAKYKRGADKSSQSLGSPWYFSAVAGAAGGVAVALVLAGPRVTVRLLEDWFYGNTDVPWAANQWQLWQWGFFACSAVAVCAFSILAFHFRKGGPFRLTSFAVFGVALAGLVGGGLTVKAQSEATTTVLGTAVSCPEGVDFGAVSRRVCLPSTSGLSVVTESASADAVWKSLNLGAPFVSSLDDPAESVRVALQDGHYSCLTFYLLVSSKLPASPPPLEQNIPLLDEDDNTIKIITLSRQTPENKDRRALFGGNHYWHFSGEEFIGEGKVSSVDRYVAYSVKNGKPDLGRYGTTRASVYVVQRSCRVAEQAEIDKLTAALLTDLKFGDDSSLDNVYFRSSPEALEAAGITLANFIVPLNEALQPPAENYTAPSLGTRQALAAAQLSLPNSGQAMLSLEPPQEKYHWGEPDSEHEGWTSLPITPEDPQAASFTFYSKLVDGPKGKLRIVVEVYTKPDPGDSGRRALKTLLDGIHLAAPDASTAPPPTPTLTK